jgi:Lytic polysaccharide mono-oxygenase, cellulose-degrading
MQVARMGVLASLLWTAAAEGHTKLTAPPDWLVTDSLGDPQKEGPCGSTAGTPSNAITTVQAGSKLTVRWTETVYHPGHWRIAIASDRTQLVTPVPVVEPNNCVSAPIEASPTAPVLLDGVFPHTAPGPTDYSQDITVPDTTCDACTLQLVQFMSSHAPPCFYFHCATLRIVKGDGGTEPGLDAGTGGGPPAMPAASGCGSGARGPLALAALAVGLLSLDRTARGRAGFPPDHGSAQSRCRPRGAVASRSRRRSR